MFYKKKGLPEENSIVLCTVKKILFHSIFVELDEYEHQEGMIHISEIAPGRIRNIRDYVIEGKKLVVQVLRVDKERRQVDLSLRRVPLSLRNKKNEEYKEEIKPVEVVVNTTLILQSFSEKGVEDIKTVLEEAEKYAKKKEIKVNIVYISAPKYRIEVTSAEYKIAEEELEEVNKVIFDEMKKRKGIVELVKKK